MAIHAFLFARGDSGHLALAHPARRRSGPQLTAAELFAKTQERLNRAELALELVRRQDRAEETLPAAVRDRLGEAELRLIHPHGCMTDQADGRECADRIQALQVALRAVANEPSPAHVEAAWAALLAATAALQAWEQQRGDQ